LGDDTADPESGKHDSDGHDNKDSQADDVADVQAADGADGSTPDEGKQAVDQSAGEPSPPAPAATTPPEPVPDPTLLAPPAEPVAEQVNPTTKTPCEIAAEELPNVGE
jgi:hypothetical protein